MPDRITTGEGTVNCVIRDGGFVESASQTIPIQLQRIDIDIFPEGGDLIGGIPCRFYVEAFTKKGEPADINGNLFLLFF